MECGAALKLNQYIYLGIASTICLLITQKANAQEKPINTKDIGLITNIPRLSDIERPQTSVRDWLAQSAPTPPQIKITGVRINRTDDTFELILETPDGEISAPETLQEGNIFIADIPNAILALPEGREFREDTPVDGISYVTVTQEESNNTVRVTIASPGNLPTIQVVNQSNNLTIAVTPTSPDIELIVTAQKRPEDAQDVPLSLTVIPQQEIEDAQIRSFQDIANNTPNFSFLPTTAGSADFGYYSVRGLNNFNFLANQDTVGFYIDDVPFDYGGFLDVGLIDLARVEVLRGPQSTLYGRSSPAGVVNVISRPPSNQPEMQISALYGSYNSRELQLSLSDAIIPDKLAFRLAGAYNARDGVFDNIFLNKPIGERSQLTGRAQILWTPTPEWNISFNAYASDNDNGNPTFSRQNAQNPFQVSQEVDGFNRLSTNTQALKISYNGNGFRATSITSRRFSNQNTLVGDNFPGDLLQQIIGINSTLWSQEFRLQSPESADRLRWLLGGYYESRNFNVLDDTFKYTDAGAVAFGVPAPGSDRVSAEQNRQTYAIFGQIDYKPIAPLTLFAGWRYETADAELDRRRVFVNPDGTVNPPTAEVRNATLNSDAFIPRFGLQYRFNPNLMAYATIAKGYRPSGFNYRADTEDTRRFQEETTWTYEVGLKSSWLDDRLSANLSIFQSDVDNYQVLLTDDFGFFRNVTNANVKVTGLEFELKAKPLQGLDLIAGIGYVDSKFKNYRNPFTNGDFSNNRVPFAPELTYNLAVQYRSPGGIFARAELRGYGITYFDDANQVKQDPYALVNARIGYEGEKYGIYLYANNLFDTRYITSGFLFPPPNVTAGFGDPVTYGVRVSASF
ncbi:TonB-dependent receptor (plasmid) [Trichormus variabilis ATCC 29413]|uniref:TonB-dependent receptor n=2 Tax=Anabaena variabilis TaxID=264691 RepID=Q3M289_TRIV2|nr:TonB-dependent receptor [Trichormus variabilis ATCC 29413]